MFGSDRGRFYEEKKRAVDNFTQNGPLIKTMMTRCIHCTRCVRFANEVSSFSLGVLDRGSNMEIGTYYNVDLLDPLSGNIIDLCPVGALTSMPYAFKQRPWESYFYTNIDFLDSLASTVRLYIYSNKIVRVLPLLNEALNEEWITNKARFSYDSLLINRINYPKLNLLNKYIVISWDFATVIFFYFFKFTLLANNNIISSIGYFSDLQTSLSLKTFFNMFGCSNILYNLKKINWVYDLTEFFCLNILIEKLELIKFFLFLSCDLRLESPLLNIRIKKNYNINKNNELFLYSFGLSLNQSTYPIKNIGNTVLKFLNFIEGKIRFACDLFMKNFYTFNIFNIKFFFNMQLLFFVGNSILLRNDSKSFFNSIFINLNNKFPIFIFSVINSYLGFYSYSSLLINRNNIKLTKVKPKSLFYVLSNEINIFKNKIKKYFVFQSFLKNLLYFDADLIFSTTALYEFDSLYINLEGKYRYIKQSIKAFDGVYNDWEIISLLNVFYKKNNLIKVNYFYNFYKIINYFIKIINYYCNFFLSFNVFLNELFYSIGYTDNLYKAFNIIYKDWKTIVINKVIKFNNTIFNSFINNYYITDFYTKNSKTMSFSSLKKYRIFKF